jgi:multisubunit Na+/H+ antiporter MnhF subunit
MILKNKPDLRNGLVVYVITFTLAAIVALYRAFTGKDFMDTVIFQSQLLYNITGEFKCFSWWPISHFIMYIILGVVAPEYWILWFCTGIGWEILEAGVGKMMSAAGRDNLLRSLNSQTQYGDNWVAGSLTDVVFNSVGLGIGVLLSRMIDKKAEDSTKAYKVSYNLQNK